MRTIAEEMLSRINAEIKLLNYDNDITADDALHMVKFITPLYSQLRKLVLDYVFPTNEDEILFFKEIKPNILDKYLYFSKVYSIEMKCPIGNNEIIKEYLNQELEELTRFFRDNLDFYQYYRSKSTYMDNLYFVRKKTDIQLLLDSFQYDRDPLFSTEYDYKIAKILCNEMLRIYLNQRLVKLGNTNQLEHKLQQLDKYIFRFTGKKAYLIELGYSLVSSGDINNGNVEIKEMMNFLSTIFHIDLGDYYASYIAMKERKDRTAYLHHLIDNLVKRMNEDDMK